MTHPRTIRRRDGFTILELLVVVGIITILVALTAGAVTRYIGVQRQTSTQQGMQKVMDVLKRQMDHVVTAAKKEPLPQSVLAISGYNGCPPEEQAHRARVLWIKMRLKQEFPQNFLEAIDPAPGFLPPKQSYVAALTKLGVPVSSKAALANSGADDAETTACLLMALGESRGGNMVTADDLGTMVQDFPSSTLPGVTVRALKDEWGNPMRFYRWPVNNAQVQAFGPTTTSRNRDPDDPDGLLLTPAWRANVTVLSPLEDVLLHKTATGGSRMLATAMYHVPVLVSAGPNNVLGHDVPKRGVPDPMNVLDPNAANDNLYSYNLLRRGARGDQ